MASYALIAITFLLFLSRHLCLAYMSDCPSCKEYLAMRSSVISNDKLLHFDANISLSSEEQAVDAKLAVLRETESKELWHEGMFPAKVNFRDIRPVIESSPIFQLIHSMPKGGIMHQHTFGRLEFLVYNASYRNDCYQNVGNSTAQYPRNTYLYAANGTPPVSANGTLWRLVNELRMESGNATEFDLKMLEKLSFVSPKNRTENHMWRTFDDQLTEVGSLYIYEPVRRDFFRDALQNLLDDQIQHIEIRGIGGMYGANFSVSNESQSLQMQIEWLNEFNDQYGTNITILWIAIGIRSDPKSSVYETMVETVELQQDAQLGKYLVGFDLVDEEDKYHTLLHYLPDFFKIANYTQSNGYQPLRYFFHAGETDWNAELTAMNVIDAVLLNSSRIGHAIALRDFPSLMSEIRSRNGSIGIELCPISNQMLEYVDDIRDHPGVIYAAQGLPITVSPDDPLIFGIRLNQEKKTTHKFSFKYQMNVSEQNSLIGNDGLSYDFYSVYMSWGFSLASLKQLAINSIRISALSDAHKNAALGEFQTRWNQWIQHCVLNQ